MSKHILALDISFTATGVMVFDLRGNPIYGDCIKTEATAKKRKIRQMESDHERVTRIVENLNILHKEYNFCAVVGEVPPGFSKSARSATTLGIAKATFWTWSLMLKLPFISITPLEAKRAVCGNNNASKEDVQKAIRNLWKDFSFPQVGYILEAVCDAGAAFIAAKNDPLILYLLKEKEK